MISLVVVAVGGALGALGRYAVNGLVYPLMGTKFPLATLVVNVSGSVLMGIFYVLIIEKGALAPEWRNFLMVGLLGAFTTFSTFSLDALALWQNGHLLLALVYIFLNVALCLAGIGLAIYITRLL
ncbi:MAG: fluoride efflux transporter CrcB [Porticoccaceae bacterium]|nr:fluoride efflux transporter CrcB [Porticoccaceae bacterium]